MDAYTENTSIFPNVSMILIECHGIRKDQFDVCSKFSRSKIFFSFDMFLFSLE